MNRSRMARCTRDGFLRVEQASPAVPAQDLRRVFALSGAGKVAAAGLLVLEFVLVSACRAAPAPPADERIAGHGYPRLFLQLQAYTPDTALLEQAA
ncbi:MAG TPA: hypothetical protein DGR79_08460 [Clostridiales bacterium]|nr:hypothetical protein [Clostridiales bacterium]